MVSTQDHLPISDIKDDLIYLKDGSLAVILQTSAVNFGLLSDQEQLAIISSFAGMLNSLSFVIQIVIRSKKLDISTYLKSLDTAQRKQTNPLLYAMISRYRLFIQSTIAENEVLDKQFYIVIPVSYLEVGLTKTSNSNQKAITLLMPRRDHIIRQLDRIGLKATQLNNEQLLKLFYDIYNEEEQVSSIKNQELKIEQKPVAPQATQQNIPQPTPIHNIQYTIPNTQKAPPTQFTPRRRSPYVVEELPEDYGAAL